MKVFRDIFSIKCERQAQRDNKVIYNLLGVLLGELDRLPIPRGQEPSPDQIYEVVKKLYDAAESISKLSGSEESKIEYDYLKEFIKTQLTEEELTSIIKDSGLTNIGQIMKFLKENYAGMYDGKLANKIIKDII